MELSKSQDCPFYILKAPRLYPKYILYLFLKIDFVFANSTDHGSSPFSQSTRLGVSGLIQIKVTNLGFCYMTGENSLS